LKNVSLVAFLPVINEIKIRTLKYPTIKNKMWSGFIVKINIDEYSFFRIQII